MKIRTLVIDDHPVVLAGIECMLHSMPEVQLVGEALDSTAAVRVLSRQRVDAVVTDFSMPQGRYGDGVTWLSFLQRRFPSSRIVVMTGIESAIVMTSIRAAGVYCIISKADPELHLLPALKAVMRGEDYLSPAIRQVLDRVPLIENVGDSKGLSKRESEVLRMYAEGMSVAQIADRVGRSRKTISSQKQAAMRKLNLQQDADLFAYAVTHGLVSSAQVARSDRHEDLGDA
ncbi:response regulator [Stenotrophomonas geniculata]|uniref:response regulator n=1 Tax=Stenotrophomonas geniculata TaxID=86188 RepID=UPI0039C6FB2B